MPQAIVPAPRTWSPGDLILAPRLRADVSDAVAFLTQRPFFAGQNTLAPSWPNSANNALPLNAELTDFWNMHSTTQNSSQLYCQAPGWYLCRAAVPFAYTTATQQQFACGFTPHTGGVTGTNTLGVMVQGSGHNPMPVCCDLIQQTVTGGIGGGGDYIQPTAFQASGGAINLISTATVQPNVSARWVCANSGTQPLPIPPLATAPSPITSAWLNANVRDTINFLIYPPIVRAVYAPGASTLANSAWPAGSTVPLNAETVDNYGAFNTGTFTFTAPVAGIYYCYGQFCLGASAAFGSIGAGFSVGGGTTQWGDSPFTNSVGGAGATVTKRLRLTAGQTVQFMATQNSGGAVAYSTSANNQTRAIFVWEGA